jgi:YVTN family beta-propeller protein
VLDPAANKILSAIDLSVEHEGGHLPFAPHNVQVSPDMNTVWVTANAGKHEDHALLLVPNAKAHGEEDSGEERDEVIVINPKTDRIVKRIPIGAGLHLAHVVLTPDSAWALVTAQDEGAIYKVNTRTFAVEGKILVPLSENNLESPEPHGIRVSPDGSAAYIAILKGKSLGILDLESGTLETVPLEGAAVQTGVTPDGKFVVISLYDTKQLAVYTPDTKEVRYVKLPESAKGPIQMYSTPDSRSVYLADQGYYFGEPQGELVYKIDLQKLEVVKEIKAGQGPHGVAVSKDGTRVYITNLLSGDVSIIDTTSEEEIGRLKVGKEPNGISIYE